jgi:hypothetical protein
MNGALRRPSLPSKKGEASSWARGTAAITWEGREERAPRWA